ncbi:Uncharacterised protein [Segatella copri]|nr:Uncharacterised protein [Segatella copri]
MLSWSRVILSLKSALMTLFRMARRSSMLTAFFVLFFLPVFLNFSVISFLTSSSVSLYCKSALTEDDLMVRVLFFSSITTPWDANRC